VKASIAVGVCHNEGPATTTHDSIHFVSGEDLPQHDYGLVHVAFGYGDGPTRDVLNPSNAADEHAAGSLARQATNGRRVTG
jgi:hypothetical protein